MIELFFSELIKSSVSIAKKLLGNRLIEKNNELLEKKRQKEQERSKELLTSDQVSKIVLEPREVLKAEFVCSESEILKRLQSHVSEIKDWSNRVSFMDMRGSKNLATVYIDLDTYLMPLRTHFAISERSTTKPLEEAVFTNQRHCIVLGQPGAGKTTSMKKLCTLFFGEKNNSAYNFPLLINLRDLEDNSNSAIKNELSKIIDFKIATKSKTKQILDENLLNPFDYELFIRILDDMNALLILDGYDEISTSSKKEQTLIELRYLTKKLKKTKIIITCRTGEFNYDLDNCDTFEISPLSEKQISLFAVKWIGNPKKSKKFLIDIKNSPFWDTAIKPLSLAHLCAIYERIGSIPDRPKTVYRKIVGLLIEEWDGQRSIKRPSKYSNFEADRKFELLTHLSFHLTITGKTTVFTQSQLNSAYLAICKNFRLPENQSKIVTNEIESHTGLFIQTGYEKYEFVHKSLQEYLSAEYIVKLPSLEAIEDYTDILGAELAIATSISSNPSLYFSELVLRLFNKISLYNAFYDAFITRLIQERPDFYPCEEIVLATFSLVSNCKNNHLVSELMKEILNSSDINAITKYYVVSHKEQKFVTLRRRKIKSTYKLKSTLSIPIEYFP